MSILKLLDRPIAFHRCLVDPAGSVNAALMLSQAIYWTNRLPKERDGWFWKTGTEWTDETGLSRYEQEAARKLLKQRKLMEEKLVGVPATLHFRVVETSLLENHKLVSGKTSIQFAGKPQTKSSTETTPENTSETTPPEECAEMSVLEQMKIRLSWMFNREPNAPWGNDEEHYLVDVCKRPTALAELDMIEPYFKSAERKYRPQTLSRLLQDWTGCLDKSRNGTSAPAKKADPTIYEIKTVIEAKQAEAIDLREQWANEDAFGYNWSNPEAKAKYRKLMLEVKDLRSKLGAAL